MKYIIMAGGKYEHWELPRQLVKINGETLIQRTARLLVNVGIQHEDIYVSTNVESIKAHCHDIDINYLWMNNNNWVVHRPGHSSGYWCDAFYPIGEPACYLMGDVVFSQNAINIIVNTPTDDIEFFASAPPFAPNYIKKWAEPFAFKVQDQEHLQEAQIKTRKLADQKMFRRSPIAWELWQVIKGTPINRIDYHNYTVINDYSCDIDVANDVEKFKNIALD